MSEMQQFRITMRGFNRQDVVQYIEYMTNKHKSQLDQLNTQLQNTKEELEKAKAVKPDAALQQQLEEAKARCAELEAKLAAAEIPAGQELEIYRRAERAERMAQERAAQVYAQANAALAEASLKVQSAVDGIRSVAEQASAQLQTAETQLQEAADAICAIRPEGE